LRARIDTRTVDGVMRGVITGRDVVVHSFAIVRFWGVTKYLQCLWAAVSRRQTTFLGVIHAAGTSARAPR